MRLHPTLTPDVIADACEADDHIGFCIACGAEHEAIDPDGRKGPCEECGKPAVYGAEELALMSF